MSNGSIKKAAMSVKHAIRRIFMLSDYNRWKQEGSLATNWEPRTALMAEYIQANSKILEFGAGRMFLKKYLPEGCTYVPSDIVDRGHGTLVWDLNSKELPRLDDDFDIIVFSGVLEYIYNIDRIIQFLSGHTKEIIASYATIELNPDDRKSHGWVNDLTEDQFIAVFEDNGFELLKTNQWKTQRVFHFRKANL